MKIIPGTRRVHYIIYLHFYYYHWVDSNYYHWVDSTAGGLLFHESSQHFGTDIIC